MRAARQRREARWGRALAGLLGAVVAPGTAAAFSLASGAFPHEGEIPTRYTCEGSDVSPPLSWKDLPEGTSSLALVVEDPDVPDPAAPRRTWVHWVVFDLPPDTPGLPEDVSPEALPAGARQGLNDWKRTDYGGPCPPIGRHRYFHRLYALDIVLPELGKLSRQELAEAMEGHVLGEAVLIGTYQKKR
jgi:Raf kinase inhibitor-like YbhB/YbcL family protein